MNKLLHQIKFSMGLLSNLFANKNNYKISKNYKLIFTDIDNFWMMYDKIKHLNDDKKREEIIQKDYFNKATKGLKELIKKDKITTTNFNELLKDTAFYDSIREISLNAKNDATKIREYLKSFSRIYSKAKFKNVFFVMGIFRHAGTIVENGIVIELELISKTNKTKFSILDKRITNILVEYNTLIPLVIHEQVHISQDNKRSDTLLSKTITEGCADFLMYLQIKFFPPHSIPIYEYGNRNEFDLWHQFKTDLKANYQNVLST